MNKVRIGIIGMGRMGLTHYSIINTHPDVDIVSIADSSKVMLSMIKKYIPHLKTYTDYKDLLNAKDVDGVVVCTPSSLHYEVCKLAADNGIAVFCEKPFTTDPKQASELATLFDEKHLVNQVGYVYRFDPVFNKVKAFLDQGVIGRLVHVDVQNLSATIVKEQTEKGWRSKRENGGGATYEMGSHAFDLMEFFLGKPEKVIGSMLNKVYSTAVEDICDVDIVYKDNVTVNIHVNWSDYTYRKPMLKLDLHGTKGKMQADLYGYKLFLREPNESLGLPQGWTTVPMNMIPDTTPYYVRGTFFTNQLYAFADAIRDHGNTKGCHFDEAADTQYVIHTIFDNDAKR